MVGENHTGRTTSSSHSDNNGTSSHSRQQQHGRPHMMFASAQNYFRGGSSGEIRSNRGRPRGGGTPQSSSSSRGPPPPPTDSTNSGGSGMMHYWDSFMSPFARCWQPPLNACVSMDVMRIPRNYPSCGGDTSCADNLPMNCGRGGVGTIATTNNTSSQRSSHLSPSAPSTSNHESAEAPTMVTPVTAGAGRRAPEPAIECDSKNEASSHPITSSTPKSSGGGAYDYSSITPSSGTSSRPPVPQQKTPRTPHTTSSTIDADDNGNDAGGIETPKPCDVLCGRGGSSNRHNVHFRELIAANKAMYSTLTKKQKMLMSRKVVDTIHAAGGKFLAKDPSTGLFVAIGMSRSIEKASQALREKTTNHPDENAKICSTRPYRGLRPVDPKKVEAPPLIIPRQLQSIYLTQESVTDDDDPQWVADFPEFPPPPPPTCDLHPHHSYATPRPPSGRERSYPNHYHTPYHPSDRIHSMPPPHRGPYPFSSRQMSRTSHASSYSRNSSYGMMTPAPTGHYHRFHQDDPSWHHHHHDRHHYTPQYYESRQPFHLQAASPDYPMTRKSYDSPNDYDSSPMPSEASSPYGYPQNSQEHRDAKDQEQQHPHPHREDDSPDLKRQRTSEDIRDKSEDNIILYNDQQTENAFSLKDTSFTHEEKLPAEVESKLSLQEKVISPTGILQSRETTRSFDHGSTTTSSISTKRQPKLNTSAEQEGLAGLAALSTAAFLKLDEGE